MIEAMACCTPVLTFRCGSVAEIIDPGVTGHILYATRMAKDYVQVYRSLLKQPPLMGRAPVMSRLEPDLKKGMN
jgi:glycosyltransferase involved in cell wall biosynthesis